MQNEPAAAPWRTGDRVTVRGAAWTVVRRTPFADCEGLRLASAEHGSRTLLLPFDRPRAAPAAALRVVRVRTFMHRMRDLLTETHPYGGLRFCPAGIRLLPYQLEPAIAMLRDGCPRVLIADAVGMGKTIQAGLIVSELSHASDAFRGLVLLPAGLRQQWIAELGRHFGIAGLIADAPWLRSALREVPADVNPWSLPGIYLASIDFVKRPEALRPLEDVRWDLLVVDEAHAAAMGTDRRAAVHTIALRAKRVILLTATPHSGDPEQFAALCRIGATSHSPPPTVFQRQAPVERHRRRSTLLAVRSHAAEARMHRLLETYTSRAWSESARQGRPHAHLASIVLRKRALSSARCLALSVRRRLDLLAGVRAAPGQLPLPFSEDEDPLDDAVPDTALAAPALDDADEERAVLAAIAGAAEEAAAHESKLRVLLRLLTRVAEPLIVFTEYRDTLEHLSAAMAARGRPVTVIHGGMSPRERADAVTIFNRGGRTLVATDAASEGLNLHEACRIVLHYELPWNPSRIEQRAGRVDRIGQIRRAHEIALIAGDTAESLVLAPLVRRAAGWNGREGLALRLTESRVAELLIGGVPLERIDDAAAADGTSSTEYVDAACAEVARLQEGRRHAARVRRTRREAATPIAVCARTRSTPRVAVLIFRFSIVDGAGSVIHSDALALRFTWAISRSLHRAADARSCARELLQLAEPAGAARVRQLAEDTMRSLGPTIARAVTAARQREREIASAIPGAAQRLVQAGLFDRRALRAAAARRESAGLLRDEGQMIAASLDAAERLSVSVDLRGILLLGGARASSPVASAFRRKDPGELKP
jgi:superfamily II DNA or RNA helicase